MPETIALRSAYITLWALAVEHQAIICGSEIRTWQSLMRIPAHIYECPYCWVENHPEVASA